MAIVYTQKPSETKLLNAFNNNIITFSDVSKTAVKCSISILKGVDEYVFVITPIGGVFNFNLVEITKYLSKSDNLKDNDTPSIGIASTDLDLFFNITVDLTITFSDLTTSPNDFILRFIRSVVQINDTRDLSFNKLQLLAGSDITYFKGFPFDISFYSFGTYMNFTNTQLGTSYNFTTTASTPQRVYPSDGQYLLSTFNGRVLNLTDGFLVDNSCVTTEQRLLKVGLNDVVVNDSVISYGMNVKLNDNCRGVYLKWINEFGSWSYWLFSEIYTATIKASTIDSFSVNFEDITNTHSTNLITGKLADNTLDLRYKNLTTDEVGQIKSILTSPRVELFTGVYEQIISSANYENYWQTVEVVDGAFTIVNTKRDLVNLAIQIKKNKYTQI